MNLTRLFALGALLLAAGAGPARAADGIPARPKPFTFVTDQANLLEPADEKKLENGLRRYADNTGTQVVVVTVPSLGGQNVNAFARQLGTDWGVGQKGKNNGLVVLVASQEHKLSIEPGAGLRSTITPSVVQRVIGEMTPSFKQNNYAAGLQSGLNTLLVTANPGSAPKSSATTNSTAATGASASASTPAAQAMNDPASVPQTPVEAPSPGLPWGTLLLGAVVLIGGILLLKRLFSRNSAASNNGGTPNFYPNQPNSPQPNQPNFYPNQNQGGYGAPAQSSGPGIGGILATGAAAAAGAYLGNRMSENHDSGSAHNFSNDNMGTGAGTGAAAGGTAAADDYFSSRGGNDSSNSSPDYFSDNASSDSNDYFSGNDNSYDDSSGGGGFDDTSSDNSGSW